MHTPPGRLILWPREPRVRPSPVALLMAPGESRRAATSVFTFTTGERSEMASEHEATWLLASLRDALRAGQPLDSVWLAGAMRALAEVRHELAISFFLDCLDASDHRWRIEALTCLGFHYVLRPDHPALDRVRALLLADPEETARLTAAAALGSHLSQSAVRQAEWPDAALARALEHDPSPHVRAAAANALLAQAGVPRAAILRRMRDLTGASASLTLAAIAALARAEALDDAAH